MTVVSLTAGKVVRMRDRLWRVNYVEEDVFSASALDGRDTEPRRFHAALEQIDQGQMPLPDATALGLESTQRLLLQAQRFSLLHGTAPILGLQRSRAIPTDYQMVPLLMALGGDRVRLGIFDDVGTGKTVEAGLVIAERQARGKARRVLIVVPANLREQWRDALDHFFHIDATIVSGAVLPGLERRLLPGQSVWEAHNVVIASIDYLKTKTAQVLAHPWDLVVIDEAHLCAQPHAAPGVAAPDMARFRFAEEIARHAHDLLLLTATPHNGYTDSYASLFRMLNPSLVSDGPDGPLVDRSRARRSNVVQRRRKDIEEWYQQRGVASPFPKRDADEVLVDLDRAPEMTALLGQLRDYATELFATGASSTVDRWIAAHLQKRALSSPAALRQSLKNRTATLTRRAATEAQKAKVQTAREATADSIFTDDDEGDAAKLDTTASSLETDQELALIAAATDAANKVTAAKDPKLQALLKLLPQRMAQHPDTRRVLVFTKFKDTLDYLVKEIEKAAASKSKYRDLSSGTQVFSIDGQMNLAQRRMTFAAFEAADQAVLVATDCISEGLNLQRACAELIHYELPWNPNRLEQRNGRVDRFQQREPVVGIRTLVLDDEQDAGLLYLIERKSAEMREAYGFVPPFLANTDILLHLSNPGAAYRKKLQEKARGGQMQMFADDLHTDHDLEQLDPELKRLAEEGLSDSDRIDRMVEESFYGQADIGLDTVEAALRQSRDEVGSTDAIKEFVLACLHDLDAHATPNDDGTVTINSVPAAIADTVSAGSIVTFDPLAGMDDTDVDVIDLAHPLTRRLVDLTIDKSRLPECAGRVAVRISPQAEGITIVAHVLFRYVAHGTPPVLLEELVPVAWRASTGDPVDAAPLLTGASGRGAQDPDDIAEDAHQALDDPELDSRLAAIAAQRAHHLAQRHEGITAEWAQGLSDVEPTSRDVVAITLVYPEVKS